MKTRLLLFVCASVFVPLLHAAEPAGVKSKIQGAQPCCFITAVNQATGMVTLKDLTSGKITQVKVKNQAKLKALSIGQQVDANLHAAEPVGVASKIQGLQPCCAIMAVNQATGMVTLKDLKSGKITQVKVTNQAKLKALSIGQQVDANL